MVLRCCLRALGSGSVVYIAAASRISRQDAMRGSRSGGFSGALAWYCFDVFFFGQGGVRRGARGPGQGPRRPGPVLPRTAQFLKN